MEKHMHLGGDGNAETKSEKKLNACLNGKKYGQLYFTFDKIKKTNEIILSMKMKFFRMQGMSGVQFHAAVGGQLALRTSESSRSEMTDWCHEGQKKETDSQEHPKSENMKITFSVEKIYLAYLQ